MGTLQRKALGDEAVRWKDTQATFEREGQALPGPPIELPDGLPHARPPVRGRFVSLVGILRKK